jgi:DNA-binding CsgD family transcriptional regulator
MGETGAARVTTSRRSRRSAKEVEAIARSVLAQALRERFALTRMEAVVASALGDGLTYAEIAARYGVSYHTVHSHVKAIHQKARVRSNGRLLALIRNMEGE